MAQARGRHPAVATPDVDLTVGAIEASAHPLRRGILGLLAEEPGGLAYGEIARRLGLRDRSALAHHLKVVVGSALVGNELERQDGVIRSVYFLSEWGREWMGRTGLGKPAARKRLLEGRLG
ncbi:MAG TPA: helix-turn-helix domain-containing protein [Candidatus Thermoplasmatota archaeon]